MQHLISDYKDFCDLNVSGSWMLDNWIVTVFENCLLFYCTKHHFEQARKEFVIFQAKSGLELSIAQTGHVKILKNKMGIHKNLNPLVPFKLNTIKYNFTTSYLYLKILYSNSFTNCIHFYCFLDWLKSSPILQQI